LETASIVHRSSSPWASSLQLLTDHRPLVTTLPYVSMPISLRQQRYLVFIAEFNVQLFYLPVLKNVFAGFLSRPSPIPEPSGRIAALVMTDPIDFKAMAAEQKSYRETQRLLGGTSWLFAKQAACQLAFSAQLYQSNLEKTFFNLQYIFHPGTRLPTYCFFRFVWHGSPTTSPPGPSPACTASSPRSTTTPGCSRAAHPHPSALFFPSPH
jgi:hypothetical protein